MNFFWLVWYRPRNSSGPKHWALFLTFDTDDQAMGTIYQAEGNGWGTGQFKTSVIRGVQLKGQRGSRAFESRFYLGDIHDGFMGMMKEYCDAATDLINEHNAKDIFGDSNCQDWCLLVIKSLEDARCLNPGTHDKAKSCSKDGEATIALCAVI